MRVQFISSSLLSPLSFSSPRLFCSALCKNDDGCRCLFMTAVRVHSALSWCLCSVRVKMLRWGLRKLQTMDNVSQSEGFNCLLQPIRGGRKLRVPLLHLQRWGGGSRFYTRLRWRQTSRDLGFRRPEITLAIVSRVSDNTGWSPSHTLRPTWVHYQHDVNTWTVGLL